MIDLEKRNQSRFEPHSIKTSDFPKDLKCFCVYSVKTKLSDWKESGMLSGYSI